MRTYTNQRGRVGVRFHLFCVVGIPSLSSRFGLAGMDPGIMGQPIASLFGGRDGRSPIRLSPTRLGTEPWIVPKGAWGKSNGRAGRAE